MLGIERLLREHVTVICFADDSGIRLQFEPGGRNPDGILRYLRAGPDPRVAGVGRAGNMADVIESVAGSGGLRRTLR